jgi:predicted PurR-regulated permease PerM
VDRFLILVAVAGAGGLIYLLAPILTPFVAGALVAYLADPLADRLEALGLKRLGAVWVVFGVLILILGLILLVLIPLLQQQVATFIDNLPTYAYWFRASVVPWLQEQFGAGLPIPDLDHLLDLATSHWQQAGGAAASVLSSLSHSGGVLVAWMLNLVLIPVVVFYLLRDWDVLVAKIHDLLPRRWATTGARLAREADEVLNAVFRGQLTVMLALGTIYSLGLWLVGLNLGLLIGILAGAVSFIPYAGAATGIVAASVAALVQFGEVKPVLWVLAVFGVGQMLEGMILTPWLIGDRVGLHPVAVIFAVLAGGQLFGFLGVLLALPVASVAMVLLRHVHEIYRDSEFYGEADSPADPPTEP